MPHASGSEFRPSRSRYFSIDGYINTSRFVDISMGNLTPVLNQLHAYKNRNYFHHGLQINTHGTCELQKLWGERELGQDRRSAKKMRNHWMASKAQNQLGVANLNHVLVLASPQLQGYSLASTVSLKHPKLFPNPFFPVDLVHIWQSLAVTVPLIQRIRYICHIVIPLPIWPIHVGKHVCCFRE